MVCLEHPSPSGTEATFGKDIIIEVLPKQRAFLAITTESGTTHSGDDGRKIQLNRALTPLKNAFAATSTH
jgi:hypothetical protein